MTSARHRATRRPRRSNSRLGIVIVLAVAAVLLAVGIGFVLANRHAQPGPVHTVATKASAPQHKPSTRKPVAKPATPSATVTSTNASLPAYSATPGELTAQKASAHAVAAAAVPYPGAPPLSPTTPSVGGLRLHPKHKYVAITFDDGYNFQVPMLELLEQQHLRCTTFLIGQWMQGNKSIVKRLNADGFEIANHTWSHSNLTKMTPSQVASQLSRTQAVISPITGNQAPYLRPPGGATNPKVKAAAAKLGYRIVMWDRTFGDSGRGATPKKLFDNAMMSGGGVKPGDVILCHWGSKMSYQAMKLVLPYLKSQGYEVVTLSELIADSKPAR